MFQVIYPLDRIFRMLGQEQGNFSEQVILDRGAAAIADFFNDPRNKDKGPAHLNLEFTGVTSVGAIQILASLEENTKVRRICFRKCSVGDAAAHRERAERLR